MDTPEIRVDPIPILPLPLEGARIQRERTIKQNINEFGSTFGLTSCNAIIDNRRRMPIQIVAEYEVKNVSDKLHKEQQDWIEEVRTMKH